MHGRKQNYNVMNRNKIGFVSYSLVCDVSDNGQLYYYAGYFVSSNNEHVPAIPVNTNDYSKALKLPFRDEAQQLCDDINKLKIPFRYTVEEHIYM